MRSLPQSVEDAVKLLLTLITRYITYSETMQEWL